MANSVSDLLARVKATRKKLLDSTDLDEKAAQFLRSPAPKWGNQAVKFLQPKTGTLATRGRDFLSKPVNVSDRTSRMLKAVSDPATFNPYAPKNFARGERIAQSVASNPSNPQWARALGGVEESLIGTFGNRGVGDVQRGIGNIAQGAYRGNQQQIRQGTGQLGRGTINTGLGVSALAAPGSTLASGVLGGGLNAGIAKLTGQDVAASAGRGFGEGVRTAGLIRFTNPATNRAISSVSPGLKFLPRQAATRGIGAGMNIAEDFFLDKTAGRDYTAQDAALSGIMGMALSGNADAFNSAKAQIRKLLPKKQAEQAITSITKMRKDGTKYSQTVGKGGFGKAQQLRDNIVGMITDPNEPSRNIPVRQSDIDAGKLTKEQLDSMWGGLVGAEFEQDESGNWQFKGIDPAKAAAGMAVMGGIKAVKGKGVEAGNIPLKTEATAKLSNLMNYPKKLAEMGYSAKEIESISAPKAKQIIDNGLFASTNQGSGLQSVNQMPQPGRILAGMPWETRLASPGLAQPSASQLQISGQQKMQAGQRLQFQSPQSQLLQGKTSKEQLNPSSEKIIQQAKSQIGSVGSDPKKSIRQIADDFYTQWVNRFAPIERVADKTKAYLKSKKAELRPENDPSFLLRRLTGAGGMADARYNSRIKPLVSQMEKLGVEKGDLDVYLANRRMAGFGKAGRDIYGADPVQAQRVVSALDQKYGPELSQIASEFYKYQDEGLDELVQAGFITQEAAQAMRSNNPDYAPLQRVMDEVEEFLGLPTRKTMQGSQPIQKIKGSDKQILSPLESIIANTYSQRAAIEKNNVARSIVELQNILDLGFRKVKQAGDDTITVWRNGQKEYWQVGTDIASTAKGLNEENMNAVLRILQAPASLLRQGATGRNPDFMIPNIVRDQLDAAITSKYGYIPFIDYTRGLFEIAKKDINTKFGTNFDTTIYDRWANSGANIDLGEMTGRKSIQQSFDAKANKKKLFSWLGDALDFMGRYSEQPTRVGLFKKAYEKTGNELLSVMESRDSTVDFARMGSKMKVANSIIPFLNVGVQGFDKLIRSVKSDPKKVVLNMAIYGALPATATTLYNLTYFPEEYSEIPQYEKDANFVLVTGRNDDGTVDYLTIPKGNILPLVSNPVESLLSYMAGQDQQTFGEFATQFLSSTLPVVGDGSSPKEVAIKTIGSNLPQLIKPAAENLLNKSFWKYDANKEESKEIVPYYLKNKEPYQQSYEWTPSTYKAIGAALNVSPLQVQNLMEGYLAGYIKVPNNIISSLENIADGEPVDKNDLPILRRFVKTTYPSSGSKKKVEETKTTPFMQRITGDVSAATPESMELPDNTEDLSVLYKDAVSTIDKYQQNKIKSQYGLVDKDLEEYQQEVDAAIALKKQIEKDRPEKVFEIELDTYSSGSGATVEQRAEWVVKTLEGVSEDKLQDTINKMWEAKVLTTGASGVAAYLEDEFGIELKYTGKDAKIKKATSKKGKKITIKSSRAKLNLASTVKAPAMINFRGASKINTGNLLKLNATPPKVTKASAPKLKFIQPKQIQLKPFDTLST